jgi:hypothetical protein
MRIADGGNVGIGTTNPRVKLHIHGSGQFTETGTHQYLNHLVAHKEANANQIWLLCENAMGNNDVHGRLHGQRKSGRYSAFEVEILLNTAATAITTRGYIKTKQVLDSGSQQSFRLISCTYNGISYIALEQNSTGAFNTSFVWFNGHIRSTQEASVFLNLTNTDVTDILAFSNSDTLESVQCSTFNLSGNVGIGTTNPQAKLHVEGNISLNGFILPKYKVHDGIVYDPFIADGSTSARAGISALQLYLDGYGQTSGLKWLRCNGITTLQVFCDFDTPNGPWTVPIFDKGADDISTLVRFKAFFVSRGIPNAGRGAGQTKDAWMSVKRTITTINDPSYSYNGARNGGPILTMPFYRTQVTAANFIYDWVEVCSPSILREVPPNVTGDIMSTGGSETFGGWWNFSATAVVNSWRDGNYTTSYPDPEDWGTVDYNSTTYPSIPFRVCGIFR